LTISYNPNSRLNFSVLSSLVMAADADFHLEARRYLHSRSKKAKAVQTMACAKESGKHMHTEEDIHEIAKTSLLP